MLSIISLLDDRARPKGSRDPLGMEAVWSFMGRKVVGNLTTVTSNLDNFIVALLCCRYADNQSTKIETIQENFMRAEQLAAYLKLAAKDHLKLAAFLGITRARWNFQEVELELGMSPSAQLLSDQLSYGLWGLYSSAIAGAGLITGIERRPTARGKALIDIILKELGADNWKDFQRLASQDNVTKSALTNLADRFCGMLLSPTLRKLVVSELIAKQKDCDLQGKLYEAANNYLANKERTIEAQSFCAWLLDREEASTELKTVVEKINDIETLLVLANTLISWLQGQKNVRISELQSDLEPRLKGIACKTSWQQETAIPHRAFLDALIFAINKGSAEEVISIVLKQNKNVMLHRGGAAWVEVNSQQSLMVRVPNDKASLPQDLVSYSQKWQNSYFIGSFLNIIKQGESWRR